MTPPAAPLEFLCIGAQKAGTTWLWEMLRMHPEIWMPPLKELHYFDRSLDYPSDSFLAANQPLHRIFGSQPHHREFRRKWRGVVRRAVRRRDWRSLRWSLRFGFGVCSDRWYASLFRESKAPVRGEITPSYSILQPADVARVQKLAPHLRIIFLLRNPIERAWSQIRFDWTRGAFDGIDDLASIRAFIESPHQDLRSDYLRTLDIWEAHFPREQIHVGFYDDILDDPASMLAKLLHFLGAAQDDTPSEALARRFNVSREKSIPPAIRGYLEEKYAPLVGALSERVGGRAQQWREELEASAKCT